METTPPFGRVPSPINDAHLPTLAAALDRAAAEAALRRRSSSAVAPGELTVRSARIAAYKPGRRCLIEYELGVPRGDGTTETLVVLGKIRANRSAKSGDRLLRALWNSGFSADSPDGISVPEPLGTVPALNMWLQKKVDGRLATTALPEREGETLPERIAAAAQKLHTCGVPAARRHTMADELRILDWCLRDVAAQDASLATRLGHLMDACARIAALLPAPAWCPSHRDFYSDQVIVAGTRAFLIDFDLYCEADPGLDIGNFLGHVAEQALRTTGRADGLRQAERAIEDQFVELAGEDVRFAVRVYAALTLARHVYLSTRVAGRQSLTAAVLDTAEERLGRIAADGGHA